MHQQTTTTTQYENLNFDNHINIIQADFFPTRFSLHWHKYVEIALLPLGANIEHSPIIRINQVTYAFQPGDLLFIWPGELHEIVDNKEGKLIGLQFSSTLLNNLPDFIPYLNLFRTYHHILHSQTPELAKELLPYIDQMLVIQKNKFHFEGTKLLIQLYQLFMSFALYLDDTVLKGTSTTLHGSNVSLEKINLACQYISENCEHHLTLDQVSSYIGFSTCYFSRLFKQFTSYSFVEYLTRQRIKRAQALLSDSSLSITEISYEAGFKSISTFNRVFLQYEGCSPSNYRRYYLT